MSYGGATALHSINASGQVNKEFVYYIAKGVQKRRVYVVPANPQTPRQQAKRAFFRNGMIYWGNLPEIEKQEYIRKAKIIKAGWIGYNYFMRLWMRGKIVMECIKSIQKGSVSAVTGNNDITISEVDLSKSVVLINSYASSVEVSGTVYAVSVLGGYLTTTTNLRIEVQLANVANAKIYWQVIEYF